MKQHPLQTLFLPDTHSSVHPIPENISKLCIYLKVLFEFTYYIGLSSFRLKFQSGLATLQTWWLQKLLSCVACTLTVPWLFQRVRSRFPNGNRISPDGFFKFSFSVISAIAKFTALKSFWLDGHKFAEICNYINFNDNTNLIRPRSIIIESSSEKWNVSLKTKVYTVFSLLFMTFLSCVLLLITNGGGTGFGPGDRKKPESYEISLWEEFIFAGRYNLFLPEKNLIQEICLFDHLLGLSALFGYVIRRLLGLYCDILILTCALTLWMATRRLEKHLTKRNDADMKGISHYGEITWETVKREIIFLKKLSSLINETVGSNITWFTIESLLYYSTYFTELFAINGGFIMKMVTVVNLIIFAVEALLTLLMSADVCEKVLLFDFSIKISIMQSCNASYAFVR